MNNIKPYFVEDIARDLKAAYFAYNKDLGSARVIFYLCMVYDIKPTFMKPEHIQALHKEFEKG